LKVEEKGGTGPRKDVVAASQRGRSHAQEGKPRDDHFKLHHCEDSDWYIIAVADGAGSAKYSRKGSEIACETVVDFCKEHLQNCTEFEDKIRAYHNAENEEEARKQMANIIYSIIGNAAFKAQKNIKEAAETNSAVAKDMATTLMFAICKKFEFGWFVASYWVGDGAMCLFNQEKQTFKLLGIPDEGEFSGQTRFLTMPEIFIDAQAVMSRLRFSIEEDFTALMLMTDGISDPMFETENNLNSYDKWNEFWTKLKTGFSEDNIPGVELVDDNEEAKNQLLRWMDFWSPGNHDDRTIAILY
jgi:serine/threonine protein phosphatase PrpC